MGAKTERTGNLRRALVGVAGHSEVLHPKEGLLKNPLTTQDKYRHDDGTHEGDLQHSW